MVSDPLHRWAESLLDVPVDPAHGCVWVTKDEVRAVLDTVLDAERARPDALGEAAADRDRWRDEAFYQYRLRNGIAAADRPVTDLGDVDPFARHEAQARLRKSVAAFFRVYDGPHEGAWGDAVNEAVAEMRGALDAERSNEIAVGNATVLTVGRRVVVDGTVFEVRPGPTLAPVGEVFDMVDDEGDDGD